MTTSAKSETVKWYVQRNIEEVEFKEFKQAIENHGDICIDFFHIPFDNAYPEIDFNYPAIFYCAGEILDNLYAQGLPGVFYDSKTLDLEAISLQNADMMWNQPFLSGTFSELNDYLSSHTIDQFFLRPAIDNKRFGGMTLNQAKFFQWYEQLMGIKDESPILSERILASHLSLPEKEYRLLINEGQVMTGSAYAIHGIKNTKGNISQEILNFAELFASKIESPDIFMLDIAINENKIGVIEMNGIHNAGVYGMDKNLWVKTLHDYAQKTYALRQTKKMTI
jgi:hypothetical protein